jgi:hypothetical protein
VPQAIGRHLLLVLAALACATDEFGGDPEARRIAFVGDELWSAQPLVEVGQMAASDDGLLIVSDDATSEVVALDVETGALRWRAGGKGGGPGEFGRVGSVTTRGGEVLVVDTELRRVSILRAGDGAFTTSFSTQRVPGIPRFACALTPDTVLLVMVPGDSLRLVLRDGSAVATRPNITPTPDPRGILTDVVSTGGMGDVCALAATRHPLFAVLGADGSVRTAKTVGGYHAPEWARGATGDTLTHRVLSTVDIEVAASHVWLLRSGDGVQRGRLVDVHELATGAYRGTLQVPWRTGQFAVTRGIVMARVRDSLGVSRIHAVRIPPELLVR